MTEENRLANIEKKLDEHGDTLRNISTTLSRIAVQEERIKHVEAQMSSVWRKYDSLIDPNTGQLPKIATHQASCPRGQIKFLWWYVSTLAIGLIAIVAAVIK